MKRYKAVAVPTVVILLVIIALLIVFYYDYNLGPSHFHPQENIVLVDCDTSDYVYEYDIIFRVGCPLGNFDIYTDDLLFELMGEFKQIVGQSK